MNIKLGLNFRPIRLGDYIYRKTSPIRGKEITKEWSQDLPEEEQ